MLSGIDSKIKPKRQKLKSVNKYRMKSEQITDLMESDCAMEYGKNLGAALFRKTANYWRDILNRYHNLKSSYWLPAGPGAHALISSRAELVRSISFHIQPSARYAE